jgi:hypothetical protein
VNWTELVQDRVQCTISSKDGNENSGSTQMRTSTDGNKKLSAIQQ